MMPSPKITPLLLVRLESCTYEFVLVGDMYVGRTLVPQEMWEEIMGYNPSNYVGARLPVDNVSYDEIQEFMRRLGESTSEDCGWMLQYFLMSEKEWNEIAVDEMYVSYNSEVVTNVGLSSGFGETTVWWADISGNKPKPVDFGHPNDYGMYDMYGNLWEMCLNKSGDISDGVTAAPKREDYEDELSFRKAVLKYKLLNPHKVEIQEELVLKGGAWNMLRQSCVKQTRLEITKDDRYGNAGFRLCVKYMD